MEIDPETRHRDRPGRKSKQEAFYREKFANLEAERTRMHRRPLWGRRIYVGATMAFLVVVFGGLTAAVSLRAPRSVATASSQSSSQLMPVSAARYGDDWPFPFRNASLRCEERKFGGTIRPVVTLSTGATTIALNGVARQLEEFEDYQKYMWPRDPVTGAFKKGVQTVSDLVTVGVHLCS